MILTLRSLASQVGLEPTSRLERRLQPGLAAPLVQGEGYYGVPHLALELSVAAGADYDVLLAAPHVCHRRRLRARGQFGGPDFFAGIRVDRVQGRIECGGGENQPAC